MNNEEYQINLEESNRSKFLNKECRYSYQGDIVAKTLYRRIKRYIKEGILDVGAGTGALVKLLRTKGHSNIKGIDLYPKVDFIEEGKITDLKFKDASFNTVMCTDVLEHLEMEQIEEGLKEIYRVLDKKRYLIITIPYDELLEKDSVVCPLCKHKFHIVGHLQSFNEKRILEILSQNKFAVTYIKVLPLSIMSKLPLSDFYWKLFMLFDKRINFYKTLIIVAKK